MIDDLLQAALDDARAQMRKSLEHLAAELGSIRAGRAKAGMLDGVRVEAYGSQMPLNQVANVSAPQSDLIVVKPYDGSQIGAIERGILEANIGLNPTNDGDLIRVAVPPLTEERREELNKQARMRGEETKIAIRNIRRDVKNDIQALAQEENLSEDMRYEAEEHLQSLTDENTDRVDQMLERKRAEITKV